jgi:hypothetical protein
MQNVVMLNVILLSIVKQNVAMLNVILLSIAMLDVT